MQKNFEKRLKFYFLPQTINYLSAKKQVNFTNKGKMSIDKSIFHTGF
jgi:hypothetical protein